MGLPGPHPAVLHSLCDLFLIKSSSPPSAYRIKSHSPGRYPRSFATGPHLRVHPYCPQPAEASFDSCLSLTCSFIIPSKHPKGPSLLSAWWMVTPLPRTRSNVVRCEEKKKARLANMAWLPEGFSPSGVNVLSSFFLPQIPALL